ncbi:hypothetical protein Pcinc_013913 [Petrolisthes cinctipes]|uniref:Uncharacterized protein n=1 Tax=Petrolisthes cinctipes TaxID=88211 RepID=A0AAE1FVY1_PETCI|nr:hypothetical protein Pcinc_013913 [Petrolisthes cinctipes]
MYSDKVFHGHNCTLFNPEIIPTTEVPGGGVTNKVPSLGLLDDAPCPELGWHPVANFQLALVAALHSLDVLASNASRKCAAFVSRLFWSDSD